MRRDASSKNDVRDYVGKVRDTLGDPRLQDVIGRAAAQVPGDAAPQDRIAALLSPDIGSTVSSGGQPPGVPYLSRAPLVSMVQTQLEAALGEAGVPDPGEPASLWSRLVHAVERVLHLAPASFTPDDPDWYVFIAQGVLERLAQGNAPFNPAPAEYGDVADDARLVIVGDWGTGLPRARDVAALMQEKHRRSAGRPVARCTCSTWATSITRGWRPRTGGGSSTCGRSRRPRPRRA